MTIAVSTIGIWDSTSQCHMSLVSVPRIYIPPKTDETEATVEFLKTQTINYLKNLERSRERSLKIELPLINSGGCDGSIFSATEIWDRIYLGIERKNDRSADTASIRWIRLNTVNFQRLLENSLREMLTQDVSLLKQRARLRNDFWKTVRGGINN